MKRFARALVVVLGLAVLGSVVSLVPQKNVTAQSGPTVSIGSSVPLTVKGNVNATVSGTVGVNNFPATQNVNVSNTPTVNFATGNNINVSNPTDSQGNPMPLATLETTQPYEDGCSISSLPAASLGGCSFQTILAGKRLVVQEFDIFVTATTGLRPVQIEVDTTFPPSLPNRHWFPITFLGTSNGFDVFAMHQETHLYVNTNSQPQCDVALTSGTGSAEVFCTISGFLLDVQ